MPEPQKISCKLGTTSLVCGLLSIFPLGALAGVPAIVLGAFALKEEPFSRGRSIAGIVLGSVGTAFSVGVILLLAVVANRTRPAGLAIAEADAVTYNMYLVQGSLEEWSDGQGGSYPAGADFDSDSSRFMVFLARDRVG